MPRTAPLVATVNYFYDANGNPSKVVDELNRETFFTYDDLNRLVSWIGPDPDGAGPQLPPAVKYDYDPFGNVLATESVNYHPTIGAAAAHVTSHATRYEYDGRNRVERLIEANPDNEIILGSATSSAALTAYVSQPIADLTDETGHPITVLSYDGNGNMTATVDPLQRKTQFHYDALNRLELLVSPDPGQSHFAVDDERRNDDADWGEVGGLVTSFTYDNIGNLRSVTDALNNETFYRYDAWSRMVEVVESTTSRRFANEERAALQDGVAATDIWPLGFEVYDVPVTTIDYHRSYYGCTC